MRSDLYRYNTLVLSLITLISACGQTIKTKTELFNYVSNPKNGLKYTEEINGMSITINFEPVPLLVSDLVNSKEKAEVDLKKKMSDQYCFILSLSSNGKELLRQLPYNQYSEMVQVLAFRLSQYISIRPDQGEYIHPVSCSFQQTYGLGKENDILISFNKEGLLNASELDLRIKEFGLNTGTLHFGIKGDDIKKIPPISY